MAVDETKLKLRDKWFYVWVAINIDSYEILGVYISETSFDSIRFLRQVLKYCEGKPFVYVDGGPWYRWSLARLGLNWEHQTFGPRNPIEQWLGIFKHRVKRFWRRFPANASDVQ
ncbi:MAG: DDE-type integrase/transposase/recombinase [Candidatus Thermoplasmatota archaeon]